MQYNVSWPRLRPWTWWFVGLREECHVLLGNRVCIVVTQRQLSFFAQDPYHLLGKVVCCSLDCRWKLVLQAKMKTVCIVLFWYNTICIVVVLFNCTTMMYCSDTICIVVVLFHHTNFFPCSDLLWSGCFVWPVFVVFALQRKKRKKQNKTSTASSCLFFDRKV